MLQPKDTNSPNGYKNTTSIHVVYKRPTSGLRAHARLKVRSWKKIFKANGNPKKTRVAILILDKIIFKIKTFIRDKGWYYIMIKESIQTKGTTIINTYDPKVRAPQYIRLMLTTIQGKIYSNKIIVGDFNTPLTAMDKSSR